jgi:hypothetical protein
MEQETLRVDNVFGWIRCDLEVCMEQETLRVDNGVDGLDAILRWSGAVYVYIYMFLRGEFKRQLSFPNPSVISSHRKFFQRSQVIRIYIK